VFVVWCVDELTILPDVWCVDEITILPGCRSLYCCCPCVRKPVLHCHYQVSQDWLSTKTPAVKQNLNKISISCYFDKSMNLHLKWVNLWFSNSSKPTKPSEHRGILAQSFCKHQTPALHRCMIVLFWGGAVGLTLRYVVTHTLVVHQTKPTINKKPWE
jgi:hypothetical protein